MTLRKLYPLLVMLPALALTGCAQHPVKPSDTTVTPQQVKESLAYIRAKLPNTQFSGASPSKNAPGLVRLDEVGAEAPVYLDPRTHYLIIGLVVNFQKHHERIAGGESLLGASSLPTQSAGGAK